MDGWNRRLSWQVRLENLEFTTCPPGFTKSISEQCSKDRCHPEQHIFQYNNEISAKQIDSIHGQNQVGSRMENGQRERKTPAKYEPISGHHHRTETVRSTTKKACCMYRTTTHRSLPFKRISTSIQHNRNR